MADISSFQKVAAKSAFLFILNSFLLVLLVFHKFSFSIKKIALFSTPVSLGLVISPVAVPVLPGTSRCPRFTWKFTHPSHLPACLPWPPHQQGSSQK